MLCCVLLVGTQQKKKLTHDVAQFKYKVKSGKFGHQVNSDMHLQTVEILMRRLLMRDFHCLLC